MIIVEQNEWLEQHTIHVHQIIIVIVIVIVIVIITTSIVIQGIAVAALQ